MQEEKTKREIIIEAAAKLFRDKGYPSASMRDLAKMVGLKPSSFYNHINSKEEILQQICFDFAHKFTEGIKVIQKSNNTPSKKVEALISLHLQTAIEDTTSVIVFNDEWRHLSEPHLTEFLTLRKDYEKRFHKIIQAGIKSGAFRQLNPSVVVFSILTSVRWIYDWYKPERKVSTKKLEKDFTALLMNGLMIMD